MPRTHSPAPSAAHRKTRRTPGGISGLVALLSAIVAVGLWHMTQGTSGVGAVDLLRFAVGEHSSVAGVPIADVFGGSRLPRLGAGVAVGTCLGVAGALLQSLSRNTLASPDTLAVTAGSYFALTVVAAFSLTVPWWTSGGVAFAGGLAAAAVVLGLSGRAGGTSSTRLILCGSAVAMGLDAGTAVLLILFRQSTTGLFAWGSGSLGQLNLDACARAAPLILLVLLMSMLMSRRLDVLGLGEESAASLGLPVRSTRVMAIGCAVLLTSTSVTLAGPIAFIGLGAPVLVRLLAARVSAFRWHAFFLLASGLTGALLILLADATVRAALGAEGATAIPTGIPTAVLGGVVLVVLALRLPEAETARAVQSTRSPLATRRRFLVVLSILTVTATIMTVTALLAGSLWLRMGDIGLWMTSDAPALVSAAFNDRSSRIAAAVVSGAALALAGTTVQAVVRNPLAEPGLLGITAGAGLGAVVAVTTGAGGGSRTAVATAAVLAGVMTFALITSLAARGGLQPDRFVLVGIGCGYAFSSVSTFLLLRSDPFQTPRILTWLSGTTYGRTFTDVLPATVALCLALPLLLVYRRQLDLLVIDEDTPRIVGVRLDRARWVFLTVAAMLAAVAVVAVGTVGFVGLVAPHLARTLVGAQHRHVIPVASVLGGVLVLVADTVGRTLLAPTQVPAGLVVAMIGAPYLVWLLRRIRE